MTLAAIQKAIDSRYPPTHTYSVAGGSFLQPTKVLSDRERIRKKHFGDFFHGERLLDIGCNKGFYSLVGVTDFDQVIGIDQDQGYIELCRDVASLGQVPNVAFQRCSFRDFWDNAQFDKIFLGNGPHHLYRGIGSHEWVAKLAALSSGQVLTEGPLSLACSDLGRAPEQYGADFDEFLPRMQQHFTMIEKVPACTYTPDRYLVLWQRRDLPAPTHKLFCKDFRNDTYGNNTRVSVFIAASSPISNDLAAWTDKGWAEAFCSHRPYLYHENEANLYRRHCLHNAYLARLGYIDIDPATINFFTVTDLYFDKSAVMPIALITERHIDAYFILLKQSYGHAITSDDILASRIRMALASQNSCDIEGVFTWAAQR